ncbi:transporter, major facilitator family protein [Limosilactobacillus coleohominis 101-4-CHN]|uniref:Transporter, major facilitator family protein n=1 Tax=Limosilactobacillus coleohominis 101-4-CHN TaxID=575594 RepID=C7XXI9_9LACO|nr:MFS transporter [Limosilactobacillus coleohominis]EEU29740.1 transporter, major facilitator family protein [Limosilactobacillus coleohominis 101-4-CHN]
MNKGIKLHWLLIGVFLVNFGNSFVWPLTTVYIHDQLHQSLTIAGLVILCYSGANVVGSYIAGILFDRYNPRTLMIEGLIGAVITMFVLVWKSNWPIYPVMLTLVGFFNGWLVTLHNSYGTMVKGHDGRFVFNMIYFSNNLGMVFATSVVGPLYQFARNHVGPLFLLTGLLYLFFILIVAKFYRVQVSRQRTAAVDEKEIVRDKTTKLPVPNLITIWTMFIAMVIIWIAYSQWSSNMSVYVTNHGISMTLYSLLWTINGLMVVLLQPLMNIVNQYVKNDYLKIYVGICGIMMSFVVLVFAKQYWWFVLGMVVLTLGGNYGFPNGTCRS